MTWLIALALQASVAGGAQECQAAVGPLYDGGADPAEIGEQVDGTTIDGAAGLARLRSQRGERLLVINGGNFAGADLRRANLRNICFVKSDLSRSDWRGTAAPGLGFIDTDLEGARLAGAQLPRVLLRQANLKDVDATGADWSGGKLDGGWDGSVENLRLDRGRLVGFRFDCGITIGDGCPLDGDMSLAAADLTGASLASYFRFGSWIGAKIDRTELSLGQLAEIAGADLRGPLRLRGGDTVVEISPADYRRLQPHLIAPSGPPQPSFACARAATEVERAICAEDNSELRDLDAKVALLYQRLRAMRPTLAADQPAWLRERDRCRADAACLSERYGERRDVLLARLGPPDWVRPGAYALFVMPDAEFAPAFKSDPLYRRILPVLIDGASGRVVVRVNPDRTVRAAGDAVGGNAHLCSLAAERLSLDPRNGWYSGPHEDEAETPAALRGRPMPVLRFVGEGLEVYRGGQGGYEGSPDPRQSGYASCGVRAFFGDMVRVPVTAAEAEALLKSYDEQ